MAVVYADLRFSRTAIPPQKDVTPESDDWEVTYENVTSQRGEEENLPQPAGPKGFCAGRYILLTLCTMSLITLTIIIALSTQLSVVSQRYGETSITLGELQEEHGQMKSSLTRDIHRKDSVTQELQETLGRTKVDLEKTKGDLLKSQEDGKNVNLKLQRALQEKAEADTTANNLRRNLQDAENKLQGKIYELNSCQSRLQSANSQKRTDSQTITNLKRSLSTTELKLKTVENSLTQKEQELSTVRKTLSNLQQTQTNSQLELQKLHDLEERLSIAMNCFTKRCDSAEHDGNDYVTYCPSGWKQIDETCYYFSNDKDMRYKAYKDCKDKNAELAKIQKSDVILKAMIEKEERSFWIGLSKQYNEWIWPDGSSPEDFKPTWGTCVKASPKLDSQYCNTPLPWICQTRAMKCKFPSENLHCFLEKMGIFREKINQ